MTSAGASETYACTVKIGYSQVQSLLTQGRLPRGTLHFGVIEPSSQKRQGHNGEESQKKCAAENRAYISGIFAGMNISQYRGQPRHDRKRNEQRHKPDADDD